MPSNRSLPRPRPPLKLEQPPAGPGLVPRTRLVDELVHSTASPLVVLTAPPGYGKTTLLIQWAAADPRPFSWIRLDGRDDDSAVLVMYLASALSHGDAQADVLSGPIDDPEFLRTVAVPRVGQLLRARDHPFVLVLDDTQVLTGDRWRILAHLVHEMPEGSQLVLAGRTLPDLGLGHLLTHRRLLRLDPDDLVMDAEEARLVAHSVGVQMEPPEAAVLARRTEGWPAGLYLAALSLRGTSDVARAVRSFSGDDRLVIDYVRDEVLATTDEHVRRFLLRTSILRALCGSVCDAVLDTSGSDELLAAISRTNGLLRTEGRAPEWYRYHQLFADVLRRELRRTEPEIEIELHRRASLWYERHDEPDEAISHAHSAGDEQRAAELVWREVATRFASGRQATLERWLAGFDGERVVRDPLLALTAAACALAAGRPVGEWLSTAQHAIDRQPTDERRSERDVALAVAVFQAVMGRRGAVQMALDADEISRLAPSGSSARALAHFFRGVAADLVGDVDEARVQLRNGVLAAGRSALPTVQSLCLAYLAYLAYLQHDWRGLGVLATRARHLMAAARAEDFITMTSVHATVALALAHEHRTHEAETYARRALRLLAAVAPIAPWLDVHTRAVLARTHLLLGDPAAARMLLAEAQQVVDLVPDAPELRQQLDQVWDTVQSKPLTMRVGPSAITPAELRVLRLLPTHLSFAEISDRLFLTRNTVKTQAISTYRKLGVSSRGEAVTQARLLGLVAAEPDATGENAP